MTEIERPLRSGHSFRTCGTSMTDTFLMAWHPLAHKCACSCCSTLACCGWGLMPVNSPSFSFMFRCSFRYLKSLDPCAFSPTNFPSLQSQVGDVDDLPCEVTYSDGVFPVWLCMSTHFTLQLNEHRTNRLFSSSSSSNSQ